MRTLNGWPLILLVPCFGVALLPTIVMVGLELARVHWWGPRSNIGLGFISYLFINYLLAEGVSGPVINIGYGFRLALRHERVELLCFIATYLCVVHFLPTLIFVGFADVLFPWGNFAVSSEGLETAALSFFVLSLFSVPVVGINFRAGYVQAREDAQNGVPPQIDIESLRKIRDGQRGF